jgi:aspartate racemase
VLDEGGEPVPVGVAGELYVGGAGVARGYWRRPELTAEKFLPDPFGTEPGARLYRTGDLARRRPDGNLEFLGRIDQQVKIRGFRVEPGEVEQALSSHPAVREAAVVASVHAAGATRLVAYIVPATQPPPSPELLRDFLRKKLPEPMIPSAFLHSTDLPRTPAGKIDRHALPTPGPPGPPQGEKTAPRDPLESALAKIWETALGLPAVGVREDFFELGGHSLLAVRVFARIEKEFGKKLPLSTLFQAPTIEQLSDVLREGPSPARWSSLVPIQTLGSRPPLFCFHPIGGNVVTYSELARRLGPDQPVYGLQAVGLDGREAPLKTIEAMAAHYVREIRSVQPTGPYFLTGSSFGGVLAFEAARQLEERGERVGLLALLDTYCPVYPGSIGALSRWRHRMERLGKRVGLTIRNLVGTRERAGYLRGAVRRVRRRFRRRARELARTLSSTVGLPEPAPTVYESNLQALRSYAPRRCPCRVTLFRAQDRFLETRYDPRLVWREFAGDGLEVVELPGNHVRMLADPIVDRLAEELRSRLPQQRADRQSA